MKDSLTQSDLGEDVVNDGLTFRTTRFRCLHEGKWFHHLPVPGRREAVRRESAVRAALSRTTACRLQDGGRVPRHVVVHAAGQSRHDAPLVSTAQDRVIGVDEAHHVRQEIPEKSLCGQRQTNRFRRPVLGSPLSITRTLFDRHRERPWRSARTEEVVRLLPDTARSYRRSTASSRRYDQPRPEPRVR